MMSLAMTGHAARTTRVNDIVYRADGLPASGTLVISWPAFTSANREAVAAGRMTVPIGANGAVDVALVPNTGSTPASFYTVVVKSEDGSSMTEFWTVPSSTSSTVAAVRSKVVPASIAAQFVGRDYVDSAIATASGSTNGIRYADKFASVQAAIDDAGTSGAVVIPPGVTAETFTNQNNRPVVDLRKIGDARGGELSVKDFGAIGSSGYYPASNMTAGTNRVTINPVWAVGNVTAGTPILIAGAGPGGNDLQTTIVSYSGGTFTVAANASTTVGGRGAYWGTDDTAAVQAAIDYCASVGGCTLNFPQGEYMISGVTIPAISGVKAGRINLQCTGGRQTTRLVGIGADQSAIVTVASGGFPTSVRGCGFESFDYRSKHSTAINLQGGIEHHVFDNYFGNVYNAILATSTFNNRIDFNRFYGAWDSCIKFVPGASAVIDTRIDDNEFGVCGGSHVHGWAVEQISTGGGGSNWLQIRGNDCEGTEWNGCFYLKNVYSPVVVGNRNEVDAAIQDGSFRVLVLDGTQNGYFAKNELSGGVELKGTANNNVFSANNYYPTMNGSTLAFISCCVGNVSVGEQIQASWIAGNLQLVANSSDGPLNTGDLYLLGGSSASNTRKTAMLGIGSATSGAYPKAMLRAPTQDYSNVYPNVANGAVLQNSDFVFPTDHGYSGAKSNTFAWVCSGGTAGTCSVNGGTWNFSGAYFQRVFSFSKYHAEANAAPTSGTWSQGDHVWNTTPSGSTPVVAWINTSGGTPGTFVPLTAFDPANPPAMGAATPNAATFTTLSTTAAAALGADASVNGKLTINQQVASSQGIVLKAAGAFTPDQVNCSGACSLAFWVKADSLAVSDGQSVTSWTDASSGGHNVAAGATAPILKANIANGKPVVRFAAATSQMASTSFGMTGPYTTFFVMQKAPGATGCFPLTDSGNESYYWSGATQLRVLNSGGSGGYPSFYVQPTVDDGKFHAYTSVVTNAGASSGYQDGVPLGSMTAGSLANWNGGVKINNSAGSCTADIAEIVLYQGTLGGSDRQKVEAYLGKKYGISQSAQKLIDVQSNAGTNVAGVDGNGRLNASGALEGFVNVAFSTTPTFDGATANTFKLTLTGNVSSSTLVNAAAGQPLYFIICQDATGSRTMGWPGNMTGAMTVGSTANKCSAQTFIFDGTNAVATSSGVANQ
jgi:hypothetical protein